MIILVKWLRDYRRKMDQLQNYKKWFLFSGLGFIVFAFSIRWLSVTPAYCFWGLLCIAIMLKSTFLLLSVKEEGGLQLNAGLYFILAGVATILLALVLKATGTTPLLYKLLLYGAITLKVTGLILIIRGKK